MGRSQVTPKRLCDTLLELHAPTTMTVLAVTNFEILNIDGSNYACLQADVEVLVDTYYSEPMFITTACEARVLLADDEDLVALQNEVEQMELAENISLWDYVDPTPDYEPALAGY